MDNPFPLLVLAMGTMALPFLIVTTTAFVKISVVLFLVRSALGVQQTPPNLVLYGVTLVLTSYVAAPVFSASYNGLLESGLDLAQIENWQLAYEVAVEPMVNFLQRFTSDEDRAFFLEAARELHADTGTTIHEDSLFVLAPAFVTAELTRAFEIGVLLYLPFVVIDIVITNILTAMGMMMVSPMVISMPFKILLFVAADGWTRLTHGLVTTYLT